MENNMKRDDLIRRGDVLEKTVLIQTDVPTRIAPLSTEVVYADDVKNIPTVDAVEVVRCRKCKHWKTDWPPSGFDPDNPRYFCSVNDIFPTGDWFCKDGERREYSLYESLKRGLEEAIAYENGENELRTEIREEGDTQ